MSLTAIVYHQIEHISELTSSTLNNILTIGNNLHVSIRYSVQLLTHVPCVVSSVYITIQRVTNWKFVHDIKLWPIHVSSKSS